MAAGSTRCASCHLSTHVPSSGCIINLRSTIINAITVRHSSQWIDAKTLDTQDDIITTTMLRMSQRMEWKIEGRSHETQFLAWTNRISIDWTSTIASIADLSQMVVA